MGLKLIIVALALLVWIAEAGADLSINQYRDLEKNSAKLAEFYLGGLIGAYQTSNITLFTRKQPQLYCPPRNLAINPDNLRQLIADFLENRFQKDAEWVGKPSRAEWMGEAGSLELTALWALQGAFPCKE